MNVSTASAKSRSAVRQAARPRRDRLVGSLPRRRLLSKVRQNGAGAQLPIHIRALQDLGRIEREYMRRKLDGKLGKHARSIERISVRTEDVNGPRGGVDQSCRIKVVLRALPSVVFESRDATLSGAFDKALPGVERSVRRALERRRMKPLRRS